MMFDPRAKDVRCTGDSLEIFLRDGRKISAPLAWFPRLLAATPEARAEWEASGAGRGIHWPALDEDISVQRLLADASEPSDLKIFDHNARLSRAVRVGIFVSLAWTAIFLGILGFTSFAVSKLDASDLGGLLSGFFAPLGLVWFIVALTHQAAELAQNTEALRLQVREMKEAVQEASRQARALEGNLRFSQIDVMYRMIEMDQNQLSTLAGSFLRATKGFDDHVWRDVWNEYAAGNRDAVINFVLAVLRENSVDWDPQLRSRAQTNSALLSNFISVYDSLLSQVEQLDQVGAYATVFTDSSASKLRDRAVQWLREWGTP